VGQDKAGSASELLPAEGMSFVQIDNPNVMVTTWKLAESGEGTVMRLEEIAGKEERVSLQLASGGLRLARLCNAMEDDLTPLPVENQSVQLALKPHEVV